MLSAFVHWRYRCAVCVTQCGEAALVLFQWAVRVVVLSPLYSVDTLSSLGVHVTLLRTNRV